MKKIIFSSLFIVVFAMYALYQNFGGASQPTLAQVTTPAPIAENVTVPTTPTPAPTPRPTPTPVPIPAPAPTGQYKNGTYIGPVVDAYYGNIQVKAIIQNGKLSDVQFLQYPNDRSRSVSINTRAMPVLKSEAISLQSANVDIVSGATDSSQAFQQSLGSALSQAKV